MLKNKIKKKGPGGKWTHISQLASLAGVQGDNDEWGLLPQRRPAGCNTERSLPRRGLKAEVCRTDHHHLLFGFIRQRGVISQRRGGPDLPPR